MERIIRVSKRQFHTPGNASVTRLKIPEHHHITHKRDEAVESKDWFSTGRPLTVIPIERKKVKGESSGI